MIYHFKTPPKEGGIYMSEVKNPSCGRIVHFYPNGNDSVCGANSAEFVPAIVVQSFGNNVVNLSVFPMNNDAPNVLRYSVHHKSDAITINEDGTTNTIYPTYWEWPQIN